MQANYKLYDGEYRLVSIVWEHEPISSADLVRKCFDQLGWKKSTTYTVLGKLCQRGVLKNENAVVSAPVKKEHVQKYESEQLMSKSFGGSLPAFIAAFLDGKKLSAEEAEEIRRMIAEATK